jgi:hypothetical protein
VTEYKLTPAQKQWASKKRQGVTAERQREILIGQKGVCALSGAAMLFDSKECTPKKNGPGCHPLCPAVDHIDPGSPTGGFQIVCHALNDLKGHLPVECFDALRATKAWDKLMPRQRQIRRIGYR